MGSSYPPPRRPKMRPKMSKIAPKMPKIGYQTSKIALQMPKIGFQSLKIGFQMVIKSIRMADIGPPDAQDSLPHAQVTLLKQQTFIDIGFSRCSSLLQSLTNIH